MSFRSVFYKLYDTKGYVKEVNAILALNGGKKSVTLDDTEALRWPIIIPMDEGGEQKIENIFAYS